jgi:4-hydroxy-tetrahydrodipicolinate synthase
MSDLGAILTAVVTPFAPDGSVDEDAFVALLAHLADHGSDGVVVAGSTGEAATLTDEEHVALVALAVRERPRADFTIVAGAGSNDTRHAVHLTEAVTVAAATDKPVILYNIPARTATDMPNDLLAELAQIERIDYVKQANNANLAPVDGLGLYAGNDDIVARTLDLGGIGGICVASHLVGERLQAMVHEPARRADLDAELQPLWKVLGVTTNPIPIKAALAMTGHPVGGLRLPLVEADEHERAEVRAVLERLGLLQGAAA